MDKLIFCLSIIVLLSVFGCKKKELSDIEKLTTPFWYQDTVYQESVMMIKKDDESPKGKLLFKPKKILQVTNSAGNIEYKENVDYIVKGNEIILTEDSNIPYLTEKQILGEEYLEGVDTTQIKRKGGGYLIFTESVTIIAKQISVTYSYEKVNWESPGYQGDKLAKTIEKLQKDKEFNLFVFGDSISTGANSSAYLSFPPHIPTWPELIKLRLEDYYDVKINLVNKAEGGKDSNWGRNYIKKALENEAPNLAIIGFGMNDGTFNVSTEAYKNNIKRIIDEIRIVNENCAIILIGTMLANPLALDQDKGQEKYTKPLQELADEYNEVIVVDIGKMHKKMLETKNYIDMTGNNVNHPNDFLARVYAMNILDTLIKF